MLFSGPEYWILPQTYWLTFYLERFVGAEIYKNIFFFSEFGDLLQNFLEVVARDESVLFFQVKEQMDSTEQNNKKVLLC